MTSPTESKESAHTLRASSETPQVSPKSEAAHNTSGGSKVMPVQSPDATMNDGSVPAVNTPAAATPSAIDELMVLLQRTRADFENFRKRTEREQETIMQTSNQIFLRHLLPILDNFTLSLKHKDNPTDCFVGLDMVKGQFDRFLIDHGVEFVDLIGKPFDAKVAEAISKKASDTVPTGIVMEQISPGYILAGSVLRHGKVIVSAGPIQGAVSQENKK